MRFSMDVDKKEKILSAIIIGALLFDIIVLIVCEF